MATRVAHLRDQPARWGVSWLWFREFLRWEVAPYPGRVNTVIRMTLTTTLVMIIVVSFRIPNAFLAALVSILLARENLVATWRGARLVVLGFILSSAYILVGMMLFRGFPITHFFWVIGSLFLVFFVIRTAANSGTSWAFVIPIGISFPLWDRSVPSQAQVEGTLWPVLIIAVGAGVTVGTEVLYRILDRSDPLIVFVDDLLLAVEQTAHNIARKHAPQKSLTDKLLQYRMIGTGRLRMTLQRQGLDPTACAKRAGLISLAGRLVSLAVDLEQTSSSPSGGDVIRLIGLSERLGAIRLQLREAGAISAFLPLIEGQSSSSFPMLQDMERTVALMAEVFQPDEAFSNSLEAKTRNGWRSLLVPDAFENPEYIRFAFAGCLAATVCYFLYNALDWPGIYISVLTCIVTALTTIGNSLQAQFLRLAGFVAGGLVLGISAQILILPSLDGIFGFAVFFAAVTAIVAWIATSSPRLSFFGVQMALSFYFVNLQDSQIQTDLTIARDKALGVFLGILAMGIIFDRFGAKSDAQQIQALLVRNVQMLSQLVGPPATHNRTAPTAKSRPFRSQINDNFANLEMQMDAARFEYEFRHRRLKEVAECQRIERVQPWLRSIYLLELSLHAHRTRPGSDQEIAPHQKQALDKFLDEYSDKLGHVAAWIARDEEAPPPIGEQSIRSFRQAFEEHRTTTSRAIDDICQRMIFSFLMLRNEC